MIQAGTVSTNGGVLSTDPSYMNSPMGRYAYAMMRGKEFCPYHYAIHPDNVEKIRLKDGLVEGMVKVPIAHFEDGKLIKKLPYRKEFRFCPSCTMMFQK